MPFPILVEPNMLLPIVVGSGVSPSTDNSMKVRFSVQSPDLGGRPALISICIRITIGSIKFSLYYTRNVSSSGQIVVYESLLPVGAIINDITTSYDIIQPIQ